MVVLGTTSTTFIFATGYLLIGRWRKIAWNYRRRERRYPVRDCERFTRIVRTKEILEKSSASFYIKGRREGTAMV